MKYLKPLEKEDLRFLMEARNRSELMQWFRQNRPLTMVDQKKWFRNIRPEEQHFIIVAPGDTENYPIGYCYLRPDNRHQSAEFGIFTSVRTSITYFAMRELLGYGFNVLNLNRIWSDVIEYNPAMRLYEILGFKKEGTLRNAYIKNGLFVNSIIIGLLREEYSLKKPLFLAKVAGT